MTADRDTCLDPGHMIDVVVGADMATCLESPVMATSRHTIAQNRLPLTGWPEAVTRPRLPQNVACGFPALRSSERASQHSECLELPVWHVLCQNDLPLLAGSALQHGRPDELVDRGPRCTSFHLPSPKGPKVTGGKVLLRPRRKIHRFRGLICHRRLQIKERSLRCATRL